VAVVCELVEAHITHDHQVVAYLGLHIRDGLVQHTVRVHARAAGGVAGGWHAEEHDAAEAKLHRFERRPFEGIGGVLDDAGHGLQRRRLGDALADKRRQNQLRVLDPHFSGEFAQGCGGAESARSVARKAHHHPSALVRCGS
jgi:hypothetical protein